MSQDQQSKTVGPVPVDLFLAFALNYVALHFPTPYLIIHTPFALKEQQQ